MLGGFEPDERLPRMEKHLREGERQRHEWIPWNRLWAISRNAGLWVKVRASDAEANGACG